MPSSPPTNNSPPSLKRAIPLPLMVFYGLGTTIGAGIYALIGELAGISGYLAPVAFLVACTLAGLTALSFAEMASRYPKAAGASLYVLQAFGSRWLSTLVGCLVIIAGLVSSAALINAFSGYFNQIFELNNNLVITVTALMLGSLAAWGIVQSVLVTVTMTALGIFGLVLIVIVGFPALAEMPAMLPELTPSLNLTDWSFIFAGTLLAFYAFIGFEDMVDVAEEVKDVKRNLPLAIIITLLVTTILYMLIMLIAVLSIPPASLAESSAPLATLYQHHTGASPTLISYIGMFAIIDGALIQIIMGSRVLYGLSSRGQLPSFLSIVNGKTQTPLYATFIAVSMVLTFALVGELGELAEITSLVMLIVFALVNLSLWRVKAHPHPEHHGINLPRFISLIAFVASSSFAAIEIYQRFN